MDLTKPIDITAVITAVAKHGDLLKSLDLLDANETLQFATGMPGITNSITLGKTSNGSVSSMYNGVFLGSNAAGEVQPRTLTVYPVKIEQEDEPERYRRSFITDVKGGLWPKEHPFEVWLVNNIIKIASNELLMVLFVAKYTASQIRTNSNSDIKYAFDGWGSIIEAEKTAGNIAAAKGNLFTTAAFTAANVGSELLKMWRNMPETFKRKNSELLVSLDIFDLYMDWYEAKYTFVAGVGESELKPVFLRGTGGKCRICPVVGFPSGSQMVVLTTKENMVYGYDKESDMKTVKPFNSGNPYRISFAGKYVFGTQFVSLDKSEFCVNNAPLTPVTGGE